jgi:hypothetical protein
MELNFVNILINVIFILLFFGFFVGLVFYKKSENQKAVKGCIMAEFWMENGERPIALYQVQPNGKEIQVPVKTKDPKTKTVKTTYKRFFFQKKDTSPSLFPIGAFIKFMQAPVDKVSWDWGNPQPINPKDKEPWITPEMINNIREDDFAAFATASNERIEELQGQLLKTLQYRMKPSLFYSLSTISILSSIVAIGVVMFMYYNMALYFGW